MEYLIQNFNWPTFFVALGAFALVSSLISFITAYISALRSRRQAYLAQCKYNDLQEQLNESERQLEEMVKKAGKN